MLGQEYYGRMRETYLRCRANERMPEEWLMLSVKYGKGNVMIWGCFGADEVEEFIMNDGSLLGSAEKNNNKKIPLGFES